MIAAADLADLDAIDHDADEAEEQTEAASRIPPHDLDAEAATLSAVLVDPAAFAKVAPLLRPEHFYSEAHRRIFEACIAVDASGKPIDIRTVATWLKDHDRIGQVGGVAYLTEILDAAPAVANVAAYAETVAEKARARAVILGAQRVVAEGYAGIDTAPSLAALESLRGKAARSAWQSLLISPPDEWYDNPPPARVWLLRDNRTPECNGFLPMGKVGQLIAKGGAGKTMLAFQLAIAVATGTPWLGTFDVATKGRVLVLVGEEDAEEVHRRLFNARRAADAPRPAKDSIVVLPLAGVVAPMLERDAVGNPYDGPFLTELRAYVEANGPWSLIIVDPLSRFAGLDAEKDNALATRFVQCLESLVTLTGATVLVFHHTNQASRGKPGPVEDTGSRGVTAIVDAARWQVSLGVEDLAIEDPEERRRLGEIAILAHTKRNYSRKAEPLLLRRDLENMGALVPLDAADEETVKQARIDGAIHTVKRAARQAETDAKTAAEDAAVTQAVTEQPGIPLRDLVPRVQALAGCGRPRAEVAIVRATLDVREGPRKARLHYLPTTNGKASP